MRIPKGFPVRALRRGTAAYNKAAARFAICVCGSCGRAWDDTIATAYTPTPSARCPFEEFHGPEPRPKRPPAVRLFVARYDSRHFAFEGAGSSEGEAVDALKLALHRHARQCGIPRAWYWRDLYASAAEAEQEFAVRSYTPGAAYRDGDTL